MTFEEYLAKQAEASKSLAEKKEQKVKEKPIVEKAKESKKHNIPYHGTDHDMHDYLDEIEKRNPRLYASIISWD